MAQLTYDEMVAVVKQGRGVLHDGAILTHIDHLPSRASLAKGNEEAKAVAAADIDKRLKKLQAEMEELRTTDVTADPPAPGPPQLRLDELEQATLTQLLFVAREYGIEDADAMESRREIIDAVRTKAGYKPYPVNGYAVPSDVSEGATIKTAALPEPTAPPREVLLGPRPAAEGVEVLGVQVETQAAPPEPPVVPTVVPAAAAEAPPAQTEAPPVDLATYTVDQLKAIAKEAGVEDYANLRKREELVAAINEKTQG